MSLFIDANYQVDREGLRQYVLAEMVEYRKTAETLCVGREAFWDKLIQTTKQKVAMADKDKALLVIDQLRHLPQFIDTWISTALDTVERFDFFVLTKAHELNSTDQKNDYYWALQIRHDKLVALVTVVSMLLDKMKIWVSLRPVEILDDPVFAGLTVYDVEKQIYLEAERIYKDRQQLVGNGQAGHVPGA